MTPTTALDPRPVHQAFPPEPELGALHAQLASQEIWVPMHAVPWLRTLAKEDLPDHFLAEVQRILEDLRQ